MSNKTMSTGGVPGIVAHGLQSYSQTRQKKSMVQCYNGGHIPRTTLGDSFCGRMASGPCVQRRPRESENRYSRVPYTPRTAFHHPLSKQCSLVNLSLVYNSIPATSSNPNKLIPAASSQLHKNYVYRLVFFKGQKKRRPRVLLRSKNKRTHSIQAKFVSKLHDPFVLFSRPNRSTNPPC